MLKIVVSKPRSFAGTDFTQYESLIKEAMNEGHKVCSMGYLHGILEDVMKYDIGCCINGEECGDFEKEQYKVGIYDVEVVDYLNNPCKAFLWNRFGKPRGLIVDPKNEEDLKYAQEKYNKKSHIL